MKISELITMLNEIKNKEGDLEVTIHCDMENNSEGSSEDKNICTITWNPEPKRLMLCDSMTFTELQ